MHWFLTYSVRIKTSKDLSALSPIVSTNIQVAECSRLVNKTDALEQLYIGPFRGLIGST